MVKVGKESTETSIYGLESGDLGMEKRMKITLCSSPLFPCLPNIYPIILL